MIGKKSSWPNHFVQLQGALHTEASLDANTPILFSLLSMLHESNLRDVHCYTYQHFAPEWSINFIKWKVTSLWDISKFQMRNLYTSHYVQCPSHCIKPRQWLSQGPAEEDPSPKAAQKAAQTAAQKAAAQKAHHNEENGLFPSTSYFSQTWRGKEWSRFQTHHHLINNFGEDWSGISYNEIENHSIYASLWVCLDLNNVHLTSTS